MKKTRPIGQSTSRVMRYAVQPGPGCNGGQSTVSALSPQMVQRGTDLRFRLLCPRKGATGDRPPFQATLFPQRCNGGQTSVSGYSVPAKNATGDRVVLSLFQQICCKTAILLRHFPVNFRRHLPNSTKLKKLSTPPFCGKPDFSTNK